MIITKFNKSSFMRKQAQVIFNLHVVIVRGRVVKVWKSAGNSQGVKIKQPVFRQYKVY